MLHGFFTLEDVQDYWWDSVVFFSCLANKKKCFTVKKLIYLNQYLQTANNVYSFTLPHYHKCCVLLSFGQVEVVYKIMLEVG